MIQHGWTVKSPEFSPQDEPLFFESVEDARHWVINHLDLSLNPSIEPMQKIYN